MKNKITIYPAEKTHKTGDLFGIFFEDLNHAADGGLYAEMVRNRAFEFSRIDNPSYTPLTGWLKIEESGAKVSLAVENAEPLSEKNPHYLMMSVTETGGGAGIMNKGYNRGLPYEEGAEYKFSCYAKSADDMKFSVNLEGIDGVVYASGEIEISSPEWTKYELTLKPNKTDYRGRLALRAQSVGKAYFDFVSLFPKNTYKNRENGLRPDLAKLLEELHPKFMRFPGGCLIHDGSLNPDDRDSTYRWKNTVDGLETRASRRNNWNYNQSLGLGYYEYFLLCEDIGAKPIPILPAGYNPHSGQAVSVDDLKPWIDDALDLIEFANGDKTTKWGKIRAEMGHSEPFDLEYIGIGNEEVGQEFFDRYDYFHKAIREKYPEIKIINNSGPFSAGTDFERGWMSARKNGSDLVDEHYYMAPEWFLANLHRYDDYPTDGPKVFLGEYASWGNTYYNALVEAAYMTQLENNADKVSLACYAPLFCNVEYVNWQPDMIWFDNHRSYGSANYYVQKMFMTNQGESLVQTEREGLDSIQILGSGKITGALEIIAEENTKAEFSEVKITSDGETHNYGDFFANGEAVKIDEITADVYTITLKAKRLSGPRGFRIRFGKHDDGNYIDWTVGGWANGDCQLESNINGRTSGIKHQMFSVLSGIEYDLKLEVDGRELKVYIDDVLMLDAEDKQPVTEELYYTASADSSGDVILKAVNVRGEAVTAEIDIKGADIFLGKVSELSGYALDSENSFENPKLVYPKEKEITIENCVLEYEFPPRSVTVIRFVPKA